MKKWVNGTPCLNYSLTNYLITNLPNYSFTHFSQCTRKLYVYFLLSARVMASVTSELAGADFDTCTR